MTAPAVTCLFLDIGGVLLTDGWDRHARRRAAKAFGLAWTEFEPRHRLMFDTYEEGKLTLADYLERVVFYEKRAFTRARFRRFMFAQSRPHARMIDLIARLRVRYALKVIAVSNEARELNAHRIHAFELGRIIDAFVSSCFVHVRKPDADMYRITLDIAQVAARNVLYIENTPMFVQIARTMGIRSILHTDYQSTHGELVSLGLLDGAGDAPRPRSRPGAGVMGRDLGAMLGR